MYLQMGTMSPCVEQEPAMRTVVLDLVLCVSHSTTMMIGFRAEVYLSPTSHASMSYFLFWQTEKEMIDVVLLW